MSNSSVYVCVGMHAQLGLKLEKSSIILFQLSLRIKFASIKTVNENIKRIGAFISY